MFCLYCDCRPRQLPSHSPGGGGLERSEDTEGPALRTRYRDGLHTTLTAASAQNSTQTDRGRTTGRWYVITYVIAQTERQIGPTFTIRRCSSYCPHCSFSSKRFTNRQRTNHRLMVCINLCYNHRQSYMHAYQGL